MNQKYIFLSEEGDRWFERNREKIAAYSTATDPVFSALDVIGAAPKRVLEIGCCDGRRLAALRDAYGCEIMGVEPSMKAAGEAAARRVPVVQSTASSLPISGTFDLIIFAFCLYLTDPEDWLLVAAEADKVLANGGHLIVHDFTAPPTFAQRYKHHDDILSYHFDFARLWTAHPWYRVTFCTYDGEQMVKVLQKSKKNIVEALS